MLVGSPGCRSGRKLSGMTNTCSWSVVLNITETEPLAENRLPKSGRPMSAEEPTLR